MLRLEIYSRATTLLLLVAFSSHFHPSCSFVVSHQTSSITYNSVVYSIRKERKSSGEKDRKSLKESKSSPGYHFFQGDGPYVPSGMSREDYAKLRNDEIEKERRMNYGAWGPRFKRTGAPEGDWMTMPNLWTAGRVNRPFSRSDNDHVETSNSPVRAFFRLFQNYSAALVLVYLLLDCLQIGFCMWKCKEEHMDPRKALAFVLKTILFQKQLFRLTVMKVEIIKLVFSVSVASLVNIALERLNRRYLWSKQRISMTTLASAVALVGLLGLLLQFVTFP
jgi:hypothetical protein